MAFDLSLIQQDIETYLKTTFPVYEFFRNTVPEDEQVPRDGDEVNPFFVLQFGPMYKRPYGGSIKGPRNDDYYSWVNVIGMGSVDGDISSSLALIVDRLIGYRPVGAAPLEPRGGPSDYGSRQYSVRPVLYYQSQRFEFSINQNGLDGFLTA